MIKFIPKITADKAPTYRDVPINQFFVFSECLYQKVGEGKANQITESDNKPYSDCVLFDEDDKMDKIILIERIEY